MNLFRSFKSVSNPYLSVSGRIRARHILANALRNGVTCQHESGCKEQPTDFWGDRDGNVKQFLCRKHANQVAKEL